MKDEIKKIIEYLKCEEEYYDGIEEVVLSSDEKVIERDDIELLLDYITNLQEENKKLKQPQIFIDTMDMEERYGQELYEDYLKEQLDDYKSRTNKAIDYIDSIDEVELRWLDREALKKRGINEYQIQKKKDKDKSLEGQFIEVNKEYLLNILKGE